LCTAVTYQTKNHYFGRNLDLEFSYGEQVTVTPRAFPLSFREQRVMEPHYAMIGMAHVAEGYPLYYDAVNETGLAMAGLNFPHSARYQPRRQGMDNVAPFEFIPWVLGQCADLDEAKKLLERVSLMKADFSPELTCTPLHWFIADRSGAVAAEPMEDGLHLYDAPVGVLTNEPPFPQQMERLADFMVLSACEPVNRFAPHIPLGAGSRGMGAVGLPGDFSSPSRFVRAAFVRNNSLSGESEEESVSQFFHILGSVAMPRGCVRVGEAGQEITRYSSCCSTDRGIYYCTTYENSTVTAVDLHREDLDTAALISYPLQEKLKVTMQN